MNEVAKIRVPGARRLPVLLVVAWLHLLLQPALASPMAPGMGNCHHAGDCPAMTGADCAIDQPLTVVAESQVPGWREAPVLALLPIDPESRPSCSGCDTVLRPPTTGPPIVIRFGHLRN